MVSHDLTSTLAFPLELISPEDLYRACVLLEPLGLPLRLRKFDSGVMVIQPGAPSPSAHVLYLKIPAFLTQPSCVPTAGQTDQEIARKVEEAVLASGPTTAVDLASLWGISLALAKEQLLVRLTSMANMPCLTVFLTRFH